MGSHRLAWNIQRAEYDRPGEISQSALASFEVACFDLMGQSPGVPVWKLLGGKKRKIRAYAGGISLGYQESGALAEEAQRYVQQGFTALKLRLGMR